MKSGIRLLIVYVALLLASYAFEAFSRNQASQQTSSHLVYTAFEKTASSPVLMLHGFFGITDEMKHLAQQIQKEGKTVFIPDLYSLDHNKGDHSLVHRLPKLDQYLEKIGFQKGHIITFGLGGPAAIHFATHYSERIGSMTLLSASATQKYELLGDYSLNKAIYSLQSIFYWAINNLIPDFGLFQRFPFKQENLRSLADIDLRPVEVQLQQIHQPSLVIHGKDDYLIPLQAARQHHALLPNSELAVYNMSHTITDTSFPLIQAKLSSFLASVENDTFMAHHTESTDHQDAVLTGPRFWFITGLVFVGTKFSEDLATVAAGLLVSRDILPFWVAVVVCFFGIMVGDTAIYFFGRIAGIGILRKRPLRWIISEQQVLDSEQWFKNRGLTVIVLSRFVPATRFPVYMATGILGVPPLKFISILSVAALIWTPLIIGLAAILGAPLLDLMEKYERWSLAILIGFFLILTLLIKIFLPLTTRKGRKIFYVRWQRLWRPARKKQKTLA